MLGWFEWRHALHKFVEKRAKREAEAKAEADAEAQARLKQEQQTTKNSGEVASAEKTNAGDWSSEKVINALMWAGVAVGVWLLIRRR